MASSSAATVAAATSTTPGGDDEELFVFGYECKIFRDDEKASWIEEGKHLIPCLADSSILIDRYDCRGALADVKQHEVKPGSITCDLSNQEVEMEKLCEVERYRDLREDEEYDETAYQEEEFKRLQQTIGGMTFTNDRYAAIEYSYDNNGLVSGPEPKKMDEDLVFTMPTGLFVPDHIELPKTMKSHAIIEKTAKFIASQGNQMEIILKTKQAANPQFDFLNFADNLNPYYKFVVSAIKSGMYKPSDELPGSQPDSPREGGNSDSDDDLDLHPSLVASVDSFSGISSLIFSHKPSAHTAYSMLVSKIQGNNPNQDNSNVNTTQQQSTESSASVPQESESAVPTRPTNEVPNQQDQLVIEKMANYVIKNGPAFETLAQTKGDPRFTFLSPSHEFHWYYLNCKERFKAETEAVVASVRFKSYTHSDGDLGAGNKSNKMSSIPGAGHTSSLPYSSLKNKFTDVSSKLDDFHKRSRLFHKYKDSGAASTLSAIEAPTSKSIFSDHKSSKKVGKDKRAIKFSSARQPISNEYNSDIDQLPLSNADRCSTAEDNSVIMTNDFQDLERSTENMKTHSKVLTTEEEEERKRMERRRKAALFMLQIKKSRGANNLVSPPTQTVAEVNKEDCKMVSQKPNSSLLPGDRVPDAKDDIREQFMAETKDLAQCSLGHLLSAKRELESELRKTGQRKKKRKRSRESRSRSYSTYKKRRSRSRSYSRNRSMSTSSSKSSSSSSDSDSSDSRSKRSKKRSKKKNRKHKSSHSRKSRKHKN